MEEILGNELLHGHLELNRTFLITENPEIINIDNFSCWARLIRSTVYVLRFVKLIERGYQQKPAMELQIEIIQNAQKLKLPKRMFFRRH